MKIPTVFTGAVCALLLLASCGDRKDTPETEKTPVLGELYVLPAEMESYNAVQHTQLSTEWIEKSLVKREWFDSTDTMLLALQSGRISFMSVPNSVGEYITLRDTEVLVVPDVIRSSFHIAVSKKSDGLLDEFNDAIRQLKFDGTLDRLLEKYVKKLAGKDEIPLAMPVFKGASVIKVGVTGDLPPLDMISADGTPSGFNAALLGAIGEKLKKNIKLVPIEANARIAAIVTGRVDAVFWMRSFTPDGKGPETDEIGTTASYFGEEYVFLTKTYPLEKIQALIENSSSAEKKDVPVP